MRKNKYGFTLAEVLISMTIIGVIMAISVQTIRIVKASYSSITYFEMQNIQRIAAELIAGKLASNVKDADGNFIQPPSKIIALGDGKGAAAMITDEKDADGNDLFCTYLVSLANTVGETNCSSLYEVGTYGGEPAIQNLNKDEPTFISSSGRRYYITKRATSADVSDYVGFRLIGVDLNGTQKPNIDRREGTKIPDIVTFLLMDTGDVFPLSYAADNLTFSGGHMVVYLNSKLKGYYYTDIERTDGVPEECSKLKVEDGSNACNYAVVYVPNKTNGHDGTMSFYTYREAYCSSLGGGESPYKNYCNGISGEALCPPSNSEQKFDLCKVENVKPVFRYNF